MSSSRVAYSIILVQLIADFLLILSAILILPYRYLVYISARIFKPHLKLIEAGITHLFCQPHIGNNFLPRTVTAVITVDGNIPVQDFRKLFSQRILKYRHTDGSRSFQRFQSTTESFMGYRFWSDEINFNLKQHIKIYKSEKEYSACDKHFLKNILTQLSKQYWDKNRSPWEITVIPCKNSQTLFVIRWHHCLADGLSMAKVMRLLMESETSYTNAQNTAKKGFQISPKLVVNIVQDGAKYRNRSFETIPNVKETLQQGASFTKPFPVEAIKGIMSRHNVSFQAVLSTVAGSALQSGLVECGQPVPKYVLSHCPLKTMDHSDNMTNDFLLGVLPTQVECSSLKARLMKSEEHFKELQNSSFSLGQNYRVIFASTLPTLLRNLFFAWNCRPGTIYTGNFPWFGKMSLLGKEVVDLMGVIDSVPGITDTTVLATGCLNRIRFGVSAKNGFPIDSEKQCKHLELELEKMINLE